ncbi:nuclear receptor [Sarcoptes scabiei]|nr:nuclear receptor [Sarcoptes scabiei]
MRLENFAEKHSIIILVLIAIEYAPRKGLAVKCFLCDYNINRCGTPECLDNYDTCSANQFASIYVPIYDCPQNCMLKAITDPNGVVLKWKRLCAPKDDLTKGFSCRIDYVYGVRVEQCTCDRDFCNRSSRSFPSPILLIIWIVSIVSVLIQIFFQL